MASRYYNGKRVGEDHYALLNEYEKRHARVQLNQGRRTLPEQAAFYATYLRNGHPLAARPWGGAPHIKWGAEHHALDINDGEALGHADSVAHFYRSRGVPVAFNVGGESWHMDTLSERSLHLAAAKIRRIEPVLRPGAKGPEVKRLKKVMWAHGLRKFKRGTRLYGPPAVRAIKRLQRAHNLKADGVVGPKTWKVLHS